MSDKYAYIIESNGSPRPYYYYTKDKSVSWTRRFGYRFVKAPDGFYVEPPIPEDYSIPKLVTAPRAFARTRTVTSLSKNQYRSSTLMRLSRCPSSFLSSDAPLDENILNSAEKPSSEFYSVPYYPRDLFLLPPCSYVRDFLRDNLNLGKLKKNGIKREKYSFDELICPGKKAMSGPMLMTTSEELSKIVISIFKGIRRYISKTDLESFVNVIRILDGNEKLCDEASVFVLTETNAKNSSDSIRNAWDVLQVLSARYRLGGEIGKVLRVYCTTVANSPECSIELRQKAMICLFRMSCECSFHSSSNPDAVVSFIKDCLSPRSVFGVSLNELIFKQCGIGMQTLGNDLVPSIFKELVKKIKTLNGLTAPNLFNTTVNIKGDKTVVIQELKMDSEIQSESAYTVASVLKYFLKKVQDPLVPTSCVWELSANSESYKCVYVADNLSNVHRDTLMYLVGFLQEYVESIGQKGEWTGYGTPATSPAEQVAHSLSKCISRAPEGNNGSGKFYDVIKRFLICLIEDWYCDEVYER